MKLEKQNPPGATGGLGVYCDQLAAKIHSLEYSKDRPELQELRAQFLVRMFAISPDLAMLLATLALGEARA